MSFKEALTVLLWSSGVTATLAMSAFGILSAQDGKLNAFALVPLVWSVALGAGLFHQLSELDVPKKVWSKVSAGLSSAARIPQWRFYSPTEAAGSDATA